MYTFEVDDIFFSHERFLTTILLRLIEKSFCTPKVQNAQGTGGGNFMIFSAMGETGQYQIDIKNEFDNSL